MHINSLFHLFLIFLSDLTRKIKKLWALILVFSIFCHLGCEFMPTGNYESTTKRNPKPFTPVYASHTMLAISYCAPGYFVCGKQCCKLVTNYDSDSDY